MSVDPVLEDFCGIARLFPLPNLVLFPQVMQPLHIFEPRYREMTRDALAGDRLLAMALLQPGWEASYEGRPAVYPIACLGKIVAEQALEDGRFNLLLRGIARIQILEELPPDRLFRTARVQLLQDNQLSDIVTEEQLKSEVHHLIPDWFRDQALVREQFDRLFQSTAPLGSLTDILAFALPLSVEARQQLLAELNVEQRVRQLVQLAGTKTSGKKGQHFPPQFSDN